MRKNKKTRKPRRSILQIRQPYRYISILSDYGFKQTFGNESDTLFLRKAIQALIQSEVPIESVEFVRNEKSGITTEGRGTLFDVICKDANETVYIVEMQLNDVAFFFQRAKFYAFHTFNTMVEKGGVYKFDNLKPIFVISFLAENVFPTNNYYQYGQIKNQDSEVMDDQITYIVIELDKWNKTIEEIETDLDKIIYIMKTTEFITKKEDFKEPEFFHEDWLQSILKELDLARMPPQKRALYEMEMARRAFEEMIFEKQKKAAVEEMEKAKIVAEKEKIVAQKKAKQAEVKAEQAEVKAEQAEVKAEQAEVKAEQAEVKAEQAEVKAEQAEVKAEQAEVKAEQAEKEKMIALQKADKIEKEKIAALQEERNKTEKAKELMTKKLLLSKILKVEQIADIVNSPIEKIKAIKEQMQKDKEF